MFPFEQPESAFAYDFEKYEVPQETFIGDIPIDVLIEERYTWKTDLSRHPVEAGTDSSDNAVHLPDRIVLTCMQGDDFETLEGLARSTEPKTWYEKYSDLLNFKLRKEPTQIVTSKRVYGNMVLTEYQDGRKVEKANGLFCTLTFDRRIVKNNQTVAITPAEIPDEQKRKNAGRNPNPNDQAAGKQNQGQKNNEQVRSDLKKLVLSAAGLFG